MSVPCTSLYSCETSLFEVISNDIVRNWQDLQYSVFRAEVDRRIVAMRKEQSEKAGVSTLTKIMGRSL